MAIIPVYQDLANGKLIEPKSGSVIQNAPTILVDAISDLQSFESDKSPGTDVVLMNNKNGDEFAVYEIDRNDTSTADDGDTIIVDADGGRWKQKKNINFPGINSGDAGKISRIKSDESGWENVELEVPSMAGLLNVTTANLTDGAVVRVNDFYSDSRGGGDPFYWDATGEKGDHNGFAVVDPTHSVTPGSAGWWTSENTGTTGVFRRTKKSTYSPEDAGTVGDGVTDDASAIQALCTYLNSVGGGYIACQNQYLIGQKINVPQEVHFIGTMRDSGFILGFNGDMFEYSRDTTFERINFDGNKANFSGRCLVYTGPDRLRKLTCNKCKFINWSGNTVLQKGLANFLFSQCRWEGCDDYAIYETLDDTFPDRPSYGRYLSCEVRGCKGAIYSTDGSRDVVYDIRVQNSTEHAYNFQGGGVRNPKFRGVINDNDGSAIYVNGSNLGGSVFEVWIRNNLQNPPLAQYSGTEADIYLESLNGNSTIAFLGGKLGGTESVTKPIFNDVGNDCEITVNGTVLTDEVLGGWWTVFGNFEILNGADFSGVTDILIINTRTTGTEPPYLEIDNGNRKYIGRGFASFSADGNIDRWHRVVRLDASGGAITVSLPHAGDIAGEVIHFVRHDSSANNARIDCQEAGASIDGQNIIYLNGQHATTTLIPNGFNYMTSNKDTLTV